MLITKILDTCIIYDNKYFNEEIVNPFNIEQLYIKYFKNITFTYKDGEYEEKSKEIIESYKKLKRRKKYQEKKISLSIFHRESGISNWTVKAHFGSWNKFLSMMKEEITLEQVKVTHTDEELLEMYRDFSVEIGKDGIGATAQEVNDHFIYNSNVLERRFKSLNKIRELLGYKPILRGKKYTKKIFKRRI